MSNVIILILSMHIKSNNFRHINLKHLVPPNIGIMVRVFANGPGDLGSIPGRVISKTLKMVFDPSLLNTQHLVPPNIGIMVRVFANGPGDQGSIPGRVIPKTLKMVFNASLLNTQHYKVRIKGKVEKSRKVSSAFSYTLV